MRAWLVTESVGRAKCKEREGSSLKVAVSHEHIAVLSVSSYSVGKTVF